MKKPKDKDSNIVIFEGSFDDASPHATTIKLEAGGGGKITFAFSQTEVEKLIKLQKTGLDKTFTVIIAPINVISAYQICQMKEEMITSFKFESGAFRNEIQAMCPEVKLDKYDDEQIKAIVLMCGLAGEWFKEKEVADILNVKLSKIKQWNTDIGFRQMKNKVAELSAKSDKFTIMRATVEAAQKPGGVRDRTNMLKIQGTLTEQPQISFNLDIIRSKEQKEKVVVDSRARQFDTDAIPG